MRVSFKIVILAGFLLAAATVLTACPRPNGYTTQTVFPQLAFQEMVGLHPVPGDPAHMLLLTKEGVIRRANVTDDRLTPTTFLDIRDRVITPQAGEEGLLGLAFAPDYTASGKLYIYYSVGNPRRTRLSRFIAQGDHADPASEQVLLEIDQPFNNHNGGALAFGPDGHLYVGVGDGGSSGDPRGNGQSLDTLLGKILRIDVSGDAYAIPADNPFVGRSGRDEIYAYGFRNPWRIAFDAETGQLWAADVGQGAWEEVDRVVPGGNYGWNVMEGAHCYAPATDCDTSNKILPRAEYSHGFGCSVTGGYVYRGSEMPELRGWYVYGDYCSGRVWAVNARADSGDPVVLGDMGISITSFAEDHAGELYMVSFDRKIAKLVRK